MKIQCDRCEQLVSGLIMEHSYWGILTGGFYLMQDWPEYRRGDEDVVCDECMLNDPKYAQRHIPPRLRD